MAHLAQAYGHLRPYEADRRSLEEIGDATLEAAIVVGRHLYGGNVTIDIKIEEGSLKVWVTVVGVLYVSLDIAHKTYGTIADYKGFKESIVDICKDAREFGTNVCGAFVARSGASEEQVYRTERRRMTPGKIGRLIGRLETLNEAAPRMSKEELAREIGQVRHELASIEEDLTPKEANFVRKNLLFENLPPIEQLPENAPRPAMKRAAVRQDEMDEDPEEVTVFQNPSYSFHPYTVAQGPPPPERHKKNRLIYQRRVLIEAVVQDHVEIEIHNKGTPTTS